MTVARRLRALIAAALTVAVVSACSSDAHHATTPSPSPTPTPTTASASSTPAEPTSSAAPTSSIPSLPPLHPLTRQGAWWGVDSTTPIGPASLANVQDWYRGHERPLVWGRYISGHYRLQPGELAFARAHGIYVYVLVPDSNCSVCNGGGDICGNDRTASQAKADALEAVEAATKAGLPAGAMLFKDVEQVGTCTGELTAEFLRTWFHTVRGTRYRAGFYGNAYTQKYDFVQAYCIAIAHDPQLATEAILADDEPEPAISAPRQTIGPANAPAFAPDEPKCARPGITRIWQYGESTTSANSTDVDEVLPGTAGLLAPDGSVTTAEPDQGAPDPQSAAGQGSS